MEETVNQVEKQDRAPQLEPWRFKPGQSGNPAGRPKGSKSLKTFAQEYLLSLSDDEKLEYMKAIDKKVIWEMAEGKAKQDIEHSGEVEAKIIRLNVE